MSKSIGDEKAFAQPASARARTATHAKLISNCAQVRSPVWISACLCLQVCLNLSKVTICVWMCVFRLRGLAQTPRLLSGGIRTCVYCCYFCCLTNTSGLWHHHTILSCCPNCHFCVRICKWQKKRDRMMSFCVTLLDKQYYLSMFVCVFVLGQVALEGDSCFYFRPQP